MVHSQQIRRAAARLCHGSNAKTTTLMQLTSNEWAGTKKECVCVRARVCLFVKVLCDKKYVWCVGGSIS